MDIAQLTNFLQTVLMFVLVLGVLVTVHEFGHFIAARLTGMRVETFAVGMGNRVFGYNALTGFTFGSLSEETDRQILESGVTDYRVAMLPIGGYVKISGMIDESLDDAYLTHEPQSWEFRSKNAAQKIFVMAAGVIMNVILAVVIFAAIAMIDGKTVLDTTRIGHVEKTSFADGSGLQAGDKVLQVNGEPVESWTGFLSTLTMKNVGNESCALLVERNGAQMQIALDGKKMADAITSGQSIGLFPEGSVVMLTGVETLKPAGKLGLIAGDTIVKANDVIIYSSGQLIETIKSNAGKEISIEWKRGASVMSGRITPDTDGRIGVAIASTFMGNLRKQHYGVGQAMVIGAQEMVTTIEMYVNAIAQLFRGKVSVKQSVGGPIQIAKLSKQSADLGWTALLRFMALLSVILAVMNILPFPALDGGHIVFILVETIIRREIPVKVKMVIQQVGVVALLCFMVFAVYNDLTR